MEVSSLSSCRPSNVLVVGVVDSQATWGEVVTAKQGNSSTEMVCLLRDSESYLATCRYTYLRSAFNCMHVLIIATKLEIAKIILVYTHNYLVCYTS